MEKSVPPHFPSFRILVTYEEHAWISHIAAEKTICSWADWTKFIIIVHIKICKRILTGPCTRTMTAARRAASMAAWGAIAVQLRESHLNYQEPFPPSLNFLQLTPEASSRRRVLSRPESILHKTTFQCLLGLEPLRGSHYVSSVYVSDCFSFRAIPWQNHEEFEEVKIKFP